LSVANWAYETFFNAFVVVIQPPVIAGFQGLAGRPDLLFDLGQSRPRAGFKFGLQLINPVPDFVFGHIKDVHKLNLAFKRFNFTPRSFRNWSSPANRSSLLLASTNVCSYAGKSTRD